MSCSSIDDGLVPQLRPSFNPLQTEEKLTVAPQDLANNDRTGVLIAEDEGSFLEVPINVLHSAKRFTVVPCQTGEAALEVLRASRFDVEILDHILPGLSGLNILQWMNEQKLDTPVIMLTGTGSEHIAAETINLGGV